MIPTTRRLAVAVWFALSLPGAAQERAPILPEALEELAAVVQGFVDQGRVVGAELLVLEGRRPTLHVALGWKDRETQTPMECGTAFNVRSMTKPVVGHLAQVMIEDGLLASGMRVAEILPEFDRGRAGQITIDHLLTHRAGLEWTACADAASLRELARCAADLGPTRFLPGTSFLYSNTGSNVLAAALVERHGAPLAELLVARVLAPLGMQDSFSLADAGPQQLARCASTYALGEDRALERVWSPADGPPLPWMQGAHGLASTPADYARFLALWMDGGALGERRLLSTEAVARGLAPASWTELPTRFPGRRVYYARHWKVWTPAEVGAREAFGHSGSDGTFAWAWPERDLIVCYFTQVVNTTTGIELEEHLARLLLVDDDAAPDEALEEYCGVYWSDDVAMVRVVTSGLDGGLALDVVGTGAFELAATDDPLRWEIPGRPGFDVRFARDGVGHIDVLVPPAATDEGPARRLAPDPTLPEVAALLDARPDPASLGVFRLSGAFEQDGERTWADVLVSDGDRRSREEVHRSKRGPEVTICDGDRAVQVRPTGRRRELGGAQLGDTLLGRLSVVIGDWRRFYAQVEVLARTERDGVSALIVQASPAVGAPVYYVVDEASGRTLESLRSVETPLGSMGKTTRFSDYREVEGVALPFRWEVRLAARSLGGVALQYEEVEAHLEPDGRWFELDGE